MRFKTLLADPPWRFKNWSMEEQAERGEQWARSTGRTLYDVMDTDDICKIPVADVADKDCTLLLWATNPKLVDALQVMQAWGFTYKTKITWAKMARAAAPRVGLGYHLRSATEDLLIGTRGNPPAPVVGDRPTSIFFCPIGEHSRKPDYQYEIASHYPGPYLEMFHRPRGGLCLTPMDNWTFAGNEVSGLDIRDELRMIADGTHPSLLIDSPVGQIGGLPDPVEPVAAPPAPADPQAGQRFRYVGTPGVDWDRKVVEGQIELCDGKRLRLYIDTIDGKRLRTGFTEESSTRGSWPKGLEVLS